VVSAEGKAVKKVILEGSVVSNKMDKTVVVEVVRTFKHSTFGKTVKKSKKYKVHDPDSACSVGDFVKVRKTNPISKTKSMIVDEIVKR